MPIVAHPKLPSLSKLKTEDLIIADEESLATDFKQELHIGLLNLMPDAALQATERQFICLLGSDESILVHVYPTTVASSKRGEEFQDYISKNYNDIRTIYASELDGLIISGANPSKPDMTDEPFWAPLVEVMDWAMENTNSIICSCLATHALMKYYFNIDRELRDQKSWGVFPHKIAKQSNPLLAGLDDGFMGPHSHSYDLPLKKLLETHLEILAYNNQAGFFLASTKDTKLVLFQGHPEYDAISLLKEYQREIINYLNGLRSDYPLLPENYFSQEAIPILENIQKKVLLSKELSNFPELDLSSLVKVEWKSPGKILYRNWLNILASAKEL
ncbi:MAG: homoserine O-succinyltransferase [Gammaproteobacteria bacterium]|nr:homoserine O-succinyltransferase [Gammaproteobacteria bacterium]|tara:strand:- start:779 stop:1771 length:993 start_codon:yes stop_codon:yes gene_type:complete